MSKSYRKIDYRLRAAKHVERALFTEAFIRIPFHAAEAYQYVGLGSVYFADFRTFHKYLGLDKMVSIEGCVDDKNRFDFNKPFSCLSMEYGMTWEILPKLDLDIPSLIWLDYDGTLTQEILSDVRLLANKCISSSFISLSINANSLIRDTDAEETPVDRLEKLIGTERLPPDILPQDLSTKGTGDVFYKTIIDEIQTSLTKRNSNLKDHEKIQFKQVFHIRYNDGSPMLTLGGFLVNDEDDRKFQEAQYERQYYYRSNLNSLNITVPLLTKKEKFELEKIVPSTDLGSLDPNNFEHGTFAPKKDVLNFFRHYRFLPNYVISEQL